MGSRGGVSGDRAEGAGRPWAGQEGLAVLCEAAVPSGQAGKPGALRRGRSSKGSVWPSEERTASCGSAQRLFCSDDSVSTAV